MIEKHSKVFVPVSVDLKLPIKKGTFFEPKINTWLKEKENVYVLTEDELKDLLYQYEMKFKNNDLISPTTFLKSKIKI
jgi:hypothetical protein